MLLAKLKLLRLVIWHTYYLRFFCLGYNCPSWCCMDIDECLVQRYPCTVGTICVNTIGSYHCTCPPGYSETNKTICVNVNECDLGLHNCSELAECEDTIGSFSCVCKTGFDGNGSECLNINECELDFKNCSANAECQDSFGSYTCVCKTGYYGDGLSCEDIDECSETFNQCSIHAKCMNTEGSYHCQCRPGFLEDGNDCIPLTCSKGQYINANFTCHTCPLNTYNNIDRTNQMSCLSCPENRFTETVGSTSLTDCKRKHNLFQTFHRKYCTPLKVLKEILIEIRSMLFCLSPFTVNLNCSVGHYLEDITGKCGQCPDGTYQPFASQVC